MVVNLENLNMQLLNSSLSYRKRLTIPEKVNFGVEIELNDISFDEVSYEIGELFGPKWEVKTDKSLTKGKNAEITSPVLRNNKETWIILEKMSCLLERLKPSYDNCSFQVNFDGANLKTAKDKIRFLKLFAFYEDIIYRFSRGEDETYRNSLDMYAYPIILTLKDALQLDEEYALELFSNSKRYGITFKTRDKNLIEFRTPNGTGNKILWQNYITTFYYLLKYATSTACDEKQLDEYIEKFSRLYLLEYYEKPHPEKAYELTKTIFRNKTDQLNFMHQYLKNRI